MSDTVVIAAVEFALDCPLCGTRMTYYESTKQYYCPKKQGGCGAFGSQHNVKAYSERQPCVICGQDTSTGEHCRSCARWVSRCQQCDLPWVHSHTSVRTCRYPTCEREYVTRRYPRKDDERQWCSDRCRRNDYKRQYDQRRKAASRTTSRLVRDRRGRISHPRQALEILVSQGYRCSACGELIDLTLDYRDAMALTEDHTVPLAQGGSDDRSNLTAMHRACNSRKGWKDSLSFTEEVA